MAEADGRWRIYAFAAQDDVGTEGGAIHRLCSWLENDAASPVRRFTLKDEDIDGLIDLRVVFQQNFKSLNYEEMPLLLRPAKGRYGLRDSEKVFCVDHKLGDDIYEMRGVDRTTGCMIVVRPDQYVAHVLPLDAFDALSEFFDGVLTPVGAG